jgi:hypothetical protein
MQCCKCETALLDCSSHGVADCGCLHAKECTLVRTVNMTSSLLDEADAMDMMTECSDMVDRIATTLHETQYLHALVEEECAPYLPVAVHCTKLFEIIQRITVLCPLYFWNFKHFLAIFANVVKSQFQSKGHAGKQI